jgi:hypothetical protein
MSDFQVFIPMNAAVRKPMGHKALSRDVDLYECPKLSVKNLVFHFK